MKSKNFYSNYSPLYPSEMGSIDFGIYRTLANQKTMGIMAKHEKIERIHNTHSKFFDLIKKNL